MTKAKLYRGRTGVRHLTNAHQHKDFAALETNFERLTSLSVWLAWQAGSETDRSTNGPTDGPTDRETDIHTETESKRVRDKDKERQRQRQSNTDRDKQTEGRVSSKIDTNIETLNKLHLCQFIILSFIFLILLLHFHFFLLVGFGSSWRRNQ